MNLKAPKKIPTSKSHPTHCPIKSYGFVHFQVSELPGKQGSVSFVCVCVFVELVRLEGGAISATAGKVAYGTGMHKSARLADGDEEPRATEIVPQIITVQGGEDVTMEVMSYGGDGWAVFIMSADGAVCNVTLHQPASPHETVIHEGCFDIVSLSGSYLPSKTNGMSSLKGVFAISLVGADGRIFGGGLAGPLIAASPVQVVIGRFATDEKEGIKHDVASGRFAADEEEEIKQDVASATPGATEPSDSPNGSSSGSASP